jgi:hypothetical protein
MRDHNGQVLAYVYFEEEPGRRDPYRPGFGCASFGFFELLP